MSQPKNWYEIRAAANTQDVEVSIYDEIGGFGVSASAFTKDIRAHAGKRLKLRLNSPGGSIVEGNAIYNALKRHKGGVDVYIDGLAASMATVVAMAGDKVHAAENSFFMIHNPYGSVSGGSEEMRRGAEVLDKMKDGIVNAYVAKTGKDADEIEGMMDRETWLTAKEAKDFGFVDVITERFDAAALATSDTFKAALNTFAKLPAALTSGIRQMDANTAHENTENETQTQQAKTTVTVDLQVVGGEALQNTISEISGKLTELQAKLTETEARATKAESDLKFTASALETLKKSLGLAPAAVIPAISAPEETEDTAFINEWNAASASNGDRTRLFRANEVKAGRLLGAGKISF